MENLLYLLLALLLVLLNGFFVLAEFALVKVRATRVQELARGGSAKAELAALMLRHLDQYLSASQLGITLASLGLGWVGEPAFAHLLEPLLELPGVWPKVVSHVASVTVAFILITSLHIVIGEQAPKMVAIRKPEWAALFSARPLYWFHRIFYVLNWALHHSSGVVLRLLGIQGTSEMEMAHSEEELHMILASSHEQGAFTLSRLLMMENILDFGELKVQDIMVPREKVVALPLENTWAQNLETVKKFLHSRYPVTKGGPEKVVGFVHVKDIALASGAAAGPVDLAKIKRPVLYVDVQLHCEDLLKHFHGTHSHLALVRDADEKYVGLVTLEDVVEELVGTIRDEFEQVQEFKLADLVPREAILLELGTVAKGEALKALVDRLFAANPRLPVVSALASLSRREAMASTGLGEGVALPHARVDGLPRPMVAFGRSKEGIDYHAIDKRPVHLIFLMVTPTHDEGAHMSLLGKLSVLLSSDYLRDRLGSATSPEEVLEIFRTSDKSLPA
ncbi:MAG: DUF21 domain-containing protein [Planctomycetes bacterium]|nr:DUF21 domain-containing protein [Planctomycetota bacterium]